ncbi:MAG: hypothetical protein ABIR79_22845, partial [Candidatus Binatia bacterium]
MPNGADAACNLIPSAVQSFRGTLGFSNKPYAAPGDFVEIGVRPAACDGTSPGLLPSATAHDVTVVFTPPGHGPHRVVVLTANCATATTKLDACAATPGVSSVACIDTQAGLALVTRNGIPQLSFRFPGTDGVFAPDGDDRTLSGPATIAVSAAADATLPCDLATRACSAHSGLRACVDDLYAADGTCTPNLHPMFPHFTALPVPNDYRTACFGDAPPCAPDPLGETRLAVDTAGNLLVPMNWQGVLVNQASVPVPRLLRETLRSPLEFFPPAKVSLGSFTPEGAPLPPIFEPQADGTTAPDVVTLFGSADAPYTILRIARGYGNCVSGPLTGQPCVVSTDCGGNGTFQCNAACVGGSNPDTLCTKESDCIGGRCGSVFADFRPTASDGGPVVVERLGNDGGICQDDPHGLCDSNADCTGGGDICVGYALEARTPVPLEGLAGSSDIFAFSVRESVAARDLNGDTDLTDLVQTLQDRRTGRQLPIGVSGALGRAVVTMQQPPFSSPALITEGEVLAFLEAEALQGLSPAQADVNNDGDRDDAILRVYRATPDGTATVDYTAGFPVPLAVDAGAALDGRSLAVSNGKVFVRVPESGAAHETTIRVSVDSSGAELSGPSGSPLSHSVVVRGRALSDDGRFVVFDSQGTIRPDLDADSGGRDVYVYDRDPDANGIFDETPRPASAWEMVTVDSSGVPFPATPGIVLSPAISATGRFVVFTTTGENLRPSIATTCPNRRTDASDGVCTVIALRDRLLGTSELVSVGLADADPNGDADFAVVTPDGRFVTFVSTASNLTASDTNVCSADYPNANAGACPDAFVRDRCVSYGTPVASCTPHTERVSVGTDGLAASDGVDQRRVDLTEGTLSADGRYVVFFAEGGYDGATGHGLWLRDRVTGRTSPASPDPITGIEAYGRQPSLSDDGRLLAFDSTGAFAPGDAGGFDVYLR